MKTNAPKEKSNYIVTYRYMDPRSKKANRRTGEVTDSFTLTTSAVNLEVVARRSCPKKGVRIVSIEVCAK